MKGILKLQIGKNGLTDSVKDQIKKVFEKETLIKISILKSACRDREEAKKMADTLVDFLGKKYSYRLIGYTLVVRKWRKAVRE